MKYIITERQLKLVEEQDKILKLGFDVFNNDWNILHKFLERRGNPLYIIIGDLDLNRTEIKSLGSLVGVHGDLDLTYNRDITDLGELQFVKGDLGLQGCTKIKNLGNLESVGGNLDVPYTKITSLRNVKLVGENLDIGSSDVESLGKLEYVGGDIYWSRSALSKRVTKDEIFNIPNLTILGGIYS